MMPFRAVIPWLLMVNTAMAGSSVPTPRSGPGCDFSGLTEPDAAELRALPAQVTRTLTAIKGQSGLPAEPKAGEIAEVIGAGGFDNDIDGIKTGKHGCVIYWYGFLDTASQRVG